MMRASGKDKERNHGLEALAVAMAGLALLALGYEGIVIGRNWEQVPRVFAAMIVPVPIAIFAGFLFPAKSRAALDRGQLSIRGSIVLCFVSGAVLLVGGVLLARLTGYGAETAPLLIESAVFSASVLNLRVSRSRALAAVLTGTSIAITLAVVFFL
ncbi:MAG: hypothetical protein AAGJ79_09225 [Verrucomicrobiota bacterium]